MQNITSLASLYKRDTKGKLRIWTVEYGFDSDDVAGTRTIAGLVDGQKVTSEWNLSTPKNVGKVNATMFATMACIQSDCEAVINYGTAGALNKELAEQLYDLENE